MNDLLPYRVETRLAVTISTADRVALLADRDEYVCVNESPPHSNPDAPAEWELQSYVEAVSEDAAVEWVRAECGRVGLDVLTAQAMRLPVGVRG